MFSVNYDKIHDFQCFLTRKYIKIQENPDLFTDFNLKCAYKNEYIVKLYAFYTKTEIMILNFT